MSVFTKAVSDIFGCSDFLEDCLIGDVHYKCICSMIEDSIVYGELGSAEDVSFTLSIRLPLDRHPVRGQKVKFRDRTYKVSDVSYDSANASISLHLQSASKG